MGHALHWSRSETIIIYSENHTHTDKSMLYAFRLQKETSVYSYKAPFERKKMRRSSRQRKNI